MGKIIDKWIADFLDRFKVGSPKVYALIVTIVTTLKFGLDANGDTADLFSLEWLLQLAKVAPATAETITEWFTWAAMIVLGTSTTAFLSNRVRKENKIAESKKISAEMDAVK